MKLYYRSEHLSCSHYSTSRTSIFKLLYCEKGGIITRKYLDETFIVFILKGLLSINYDSENPLEVGEGNAFLLVHESFALRLQQHPIVPVSTFTN